MQRIVKYGFGSVTIEGETYQSDVIIYPDKVDSDWWRKEGHRLAVEDLRDAVVAKPEILIVGRGAYGFMTIPPETEKHIESLGIRLIAANTKEACDTHNKLGETSRVVTCLHLTC
jgi:hypothetical protein